jgi:FtsH-binding integral membrane protein
MTVGTLPVPAHTAQPGERTLFLRRTYVHLACAILAVVSLDALLFHSPAARTLAHRMTDGYNWLLTLAAFMGVSSVANRWARSSSSVSRQYLSLTLAVVAQSLLFLPLLLGVAAQGLSDVLASSCVITLLLVAGLTFVAVTTRGDFSILRSALTFGGFLALGLIIASILFGFSLGLGFSLAMVAFAAGAILYNTSNVLRSFRTDQHVAAALTLFASISLLFWYVVRSLGFRR